MSKTIENSLSVSESELLEALATDALRALETIGVPAYIVDFQRRVRWQNAASLDLVGDLRGRLDKSVLEPDDLGRAREAFAKKMGGTPHTRVEVCVARRDGRRVRVAVNSVPLKSADGVMIGAFGLVHVLGEMETPFERAPRLSPREREVLTLLADGCSTAQMAEQMGIAKETVRNHVKGVLRSLGARSRVEAVAKGRSVGLI
jgi:DNA-binding CsgD family transcriptional regulator